jgi:hypothetical protein
MLLRQLSLKVLVSIHVRFASVQHFYVESIYGEICMVTKFFLQIFTRNRGGFFTLGNDEPLVISVLLQKQFLKHEHVMKK